MYYDDEARRFNFLSGLVFGTVTGIGLVLLLPPQKRVRLPRPARAAGPLWKSRAAAGVRGLERRLRRS